MSKEIKLPCQTYIIARQCECGGEIKYEPSDTMTMMYPPRYTHKCTKCGKTETFPVIYPRQMYEYQMPETTTSNTAITNRSHLLNVVNNLLEHNFSSPLKNDCKDESIAEAFANIGNCDVCPLDNNPDYKCSGLDCEEDILKYLCKYGDNPYVQ